MSLSNTPAAERVHIAFFGVRNAGKSSVVNAVTGQELSIVSDVKGTTTDPVKKTMELLPLGPVVIIDTPGIDDAGVLGEERVRRTKRILNQTDLAVLVVSAVDGFQEADRELAALFRQKQIPFLIALNKTDLTGSVRRPDTENAESLSSSEQAAANREHPGPENAAGLSSSDPAAIFSVSALTGEGIWELKEAIARLAKKTDSERPLVRDLVKTGDMVILVVPIDKAAPKGRLILPQQMVIRDLLDAGAIPVVTRDTEYGRLLSRTAAGTGGTAGYERPSGTAGHERPGGMAGHERPDGPDADLHDPGEPLRPVLVITDSQAFEKIAAQTPEEIPLTSFSMIMARYKGNLEGAVNGAKALRGLRDGDTVLISEGCTHHRQCEDIGTVKLPLWLKKYTGKELQFAFTSGADFPEDLSPYAMIIHCGGCMLNEREMLARAKHAADEQVPMTNYGTAIAEMHGILDRCVQPLL